MLPDLAMADFFRKMVGRSGAEAPDGVVRTIVKEKHSTKQTRSKEQERKAKVGDQRKQSKETGNDVIMETEGEEAAGREEEVDGKTTGQAQRKTVFL